MVATPTTPKPEPLQNPVQPWPGNTLNPVQKWSANPENPALNPKPFTLNPLHPKSIQVPASSLLRSIAGFRPNLELGILSNLLGSCRVETAGLRITADRNHGILILADP